MGSGRSLRPSGYRSRSYYLPDELHFRLRNAWWHTRPVNGHPSLSSLVAAALLTAVEELESRYNDGRPFPESLHTNGCLSVRAPPVSDPGITPRDRQFRPAIGAVSRRARTTCTRRPLALRTYRAKPG